MQGSQSAKPLRFLQKVEKPMLRASTPSLHIPQEVYVCVCVCHVHFGSYKLVVLTLYYCLVASEPCHNFCTHCQVALLLEQTLN